MSNNNEQILLNVRDTMRQMLRSAISGNWDKVTDLDQKRNQLISGISKNQYTGNLELIDEIINLDQHLLTVAENTKKEINDKVDQTCRAKDIHSQYQSIADL